MGDFLDRRNARWWNRLARNDPFYFTFPDASMSDYYRTGESAIADLIGRFAPHGPRGHALEIGSGMGRLTLPLARRYERVTAIDICDAYLGYLRLRCESDGVGNVDCGLVSTAWDQPERYDLVLSIYVMQHMTSWNIIARYIDTLPRVLRPGGVAILQFDTRPPTFGYQLRRHLPGVLAPRKLKPGYRRIRRSPDALEARFRAAGLRLVHNEGRGTTYDLYVVERSADTASRAEMLVHSTHTEAGTSPHRIS